jgi:hypothetical protein
MPKSINMKKMGRVARMGEMTNAYRIYFKNLKSRGPLENQAYFGE